MPASALQASADLAERFDRMKFAEFWPCYLAAHADRRTRTLHYLGASGALACTVAAVIATDWRWLVAAPIVGYGPAWLAHAAFERNRPGTFSHAVWSLLSDFRMLGLFLAGRLAGELRRTHIQRSGREVR
jgi:hypothetical protein